MDASPFVFVTCQIGSEAALKADFGRRWPELRFAYSRPGFVTFKSPQDLPGDEDVPCREALFARATGTSLGKIEGETAESRAAKLWDMLGDDAESYTGLHVWSRDLRPAGERDYEPGVTQEAIDAAKAIRDTCGRKLRTWVQPGAMVLDCILVDPGTWWIGRHPATCPPSCWPGGFCRIRKRAEIISRAYFKVEEALQWSQLPLKRNDLVADLGCAPGGGSQALLERGMRVLGVDPADPHPSLLRSKPFRHVKKRGADLPRRDFHHVRWLVADMNVAPNYTLDTVEGIVTHRDVNIRGVIITLKLLEWELAADIPDFAFRVRTWGFPHVKVRQLAANRQEVCLVAWRESVDSFATS